MEKTKGKMSLNLLKKIQMYACICVNDKIH